MGSHKTWDLPGEPTDSEEVFDRNRDRWLFYNPGSYIREKDQHILAWKELVYRLGPLTDQLPKRKWFVDNLPAGPEGIEAVKDRYGELWNSQYGFTRYNRQTSPLPKPITFSELVVMYGPVQET